VSRKCLKTLFDYFCKNANIITLFLQIATIVLQILARIEECAKLADLDSRADAELVSKGKTVKQVRRFNLT